MHQKKSELQIIKESTGVSSDFRPPSIHHKHPQQFLNSHFNSLSNFGTTPQFSIDPTHTQNDPIPPTPKTAPHKRPLITHTNPDPNPSSSSNSLSKFPTLSNSLHQYPFHSTSPFKSHDQSHLLGVREQGSEREGVVQKYLKLLRFVRARIQSVRANRGLRAGAEIPTRIPVKKSAAGNILRRLRHIHIHFRCILLLSLPFFYFLVSHPSHSFLLDFLSAFALSAALFFSLNLAIPRLPSIRLLLAQSLPNKLKSRTRVSRPHLPVFWSIGSRQKSEKLVGSGCWVQVYTNGDVYEGEFHKGKCSGSGVYYYYMSGRYEGDWVDGKYDGYGVETWARGSRYRGQYRQGLRHGFGVYRFYTGDVYSGEWSNGQSHGCGIHTCDDGSRFVGEFKWGVKHGLGHYHFRNGDVYAGEYFADKMHGFGIYRFASGHRYEGAWHEGKRQGLGMYTFRSGETQSGHWNNGILDVPSTQNTTYPVSPVAVYHSRVLNTVQEARRAAEKAYDVAKVDERVNRAVAAANRAANAARVAAVKAVQNQLH